MTFRVFTLIVGGYDMNEKEIYWKLNQHLKIVQQNYPIENIFGIFVIEIDEDILKIAQSRLVPLGVPCANIHLGDALNPGSYNF